MDVLYTGDIPKEYCFADFHENYIDLYNNNKADNDGNDESFHFYRIYTNLPRFFLYSRQC